MVTSIVICALTCFSMIFGVLFFPKIKIFKFKIDSYWVITILGVVLLAIFGQINFASVGKAFASNSAINPLKILALFIAMTFLSIFLDEMGFFRYLANKTLKKAKSGQVKLFVYLYVMISILTIFTSNDIIILSFTPFICYFAKNANINPTPFLAAEFVAANTWSMALIIGNPTNIYLATAYNINFLSYLKVSILPTLFAGIVAFVMLFLLFRKKLSQPLCATPEEVVIEDKPLFWVGMVHFVVCILFLAISSYIGIEMWLVCMACVASLVLCNLIAALCRRKLPKALFKSFKRTPYQLIPFVLSIFVMIVVLSDKGFTAEIAKLLGSGNLSILSYGLTSFFAANLINNIPMSVLFSSVIGSLGAGNVLPAVYATIIGSNIGAFLTPIGALAGIMWSSILSEHGVKFSYLDFLKMGVVVAVPALLSALLGLFLVL